MANNKAIQILRGTYQGLQNHGAEKPLYGQPIFDATNNYLLIGREDTNLSSLAPITTNKLKGYFDKYGSGNSNEYSITPNYSTNKLEINTANGVNIMGSTGSHIIK